MPHAFSIQAVAERTGLSPHVIRAWERRYGAVQPERSAGRQRVYSLEEVERLALLRQAVQSGHGIRKIARLSRAELRVLLEAAPASAQHASALSHEPAATFRAEALAAVARFAEPALDAVFRKALVESGHQGFLRLVVAPLAEEIGERWRRGDLTAAHEHFFTASVKVFLGGLSRQFAPAVAAPAIIVGTPLGQLHELGALMAASTAAHLGWRPIYLGPSLPAAELAGAALRNDARAVALSLVYPEDDPHLPRELDELARMLPRATRILVGGRAARAYLDTLVRIGALCSDSISDFGDRLDALRRQGAAGERQELA